MDNNLQQIAFLIPILGIFVILEGIIQLKDNKSYNYKESFSNISAGLIPVLTGIFLKSITLFPYIYIYNNYRIFEFKETNFLLNNIILFCLIDFLHYCQHRLDHNINILWAAHIVHHQSNTYNFTTGFRFSFLTFAFLFFLYLPLAFFGFSPEKFAIIYFVIIPAYMFFTHTELIGKLGWLEYIFVTPSSHRVHHSADIKKINKNYGATLIIWDRLFNTFLKEPSKGIKNYGLIISHTDPCPLRSNISYYKLLFKAIKNTRGIINKVRLIFSSPKTLYNSTNYELKIELPKKNKNYNKAEIIYIFKNTLILTLIFTLFLWHTNKLDKIEIIACTLYFILASINVGRFFIEEKNTIWREFFINIYFSMLGYYFINEFYSTTFLLGLSFVILLQIVLVIHYYTLKEDVNFG